VTKAAPESPYAWVRLAAALVLSTIGGVGALLRRQGRARMAHHEPRGAGGVP